ncbi:MAG: hypothetical protein PVG61_04070 [Dehalococcoidia bacterium]|jgi:hypothetical protein
MSPGETIILMAAGGGFIVLGILGILWGRREEKKIFEALSQKYDLREFSLEHVEGPQPGALRIGGWIAIVLGLFLLIIGIILRFVL